MPSRKTPIGHPNRPNEKAKSYEKKSRRIDDDYVPCPGNGIGVHPETWIPVFQGPKSKFARCPLSCCDFYGFYRGVTYTEMKKIGLTRAEIFKRNPKALIV